MRLESVKAVVEALNEAHVRYLVVDGLAVIAHGYLRFTKDVDVVISLLPDNVKKTFDALGRLGYRPNVPITAEQFGLAENRKRWIEEKNMKVLALWSEAHPETPLDIFVVEPFDFDKEYEAALLKPLSKGIEIRVVSLRTLIAMKEDVGRGEDLIDVRNLRMKLDDDEAK